MATARTRSGAVRAAAFVMATACGIALAAADHKFTTTWKAPGAAPFNFAGKKVAALVMTTDEGLRMSAEEALAREITARGPKGIAAYRVIPREELTDKVKVKGWFERQGDRRRRRDAGRWRG